MNSAPINYFPNRMGRIMLLAMEEILGHQGVNAILNLAHLPDYIDQFPAANLDLQFPFEHIARLQVALEYAYGPRAGRGLAMRVGRACLKYGLREFGPGLGLNDPAFRMLPLQPRLKAGCEAIAGLFNQFTGQRVRLDMDEKYISWQIERCPLCWERHSDAPCCAMAVGLLQESFYWLSGGKYFLVEEKKCIACGDSTCTIVIDRTPMS